MNGQNNLFEILHSNIYQNENSKIQMLKPIILIKTQFQLKSTQMFISQMTFLNLKFEDFKMNSSIIDLVVEDVIIFI